MVHILPDSLGRTFITRQHNRCGLYIVNRDIAENVVVSPLGEPVITLLPGEYISVPDSIEITIQGDSATRNYWTFSYNAGDEF